MRIEVGDEFVDLCADCFPPSPEDMDVIADLLYCFRKDVEEALETEPDGSRHPSYEKEECFCAICNSVLTEEDDLKEVQEP
jgi:hypothetical protein